MFKRREVYIQEQHSVSLKLYVYFNKFNDVKFINYIYNALAVKNNRQAIYITDACEYYRRHLNDSVQMAETLFPFRCMKFIKDYYELETREDVRKMFELGLESETYKNADLRRISCKPSQMRVTLGFRTKEDRYTSMHDELYHLSPSDRVIDITNYVSKYVADGKDSQILMLFAYELVYESMTEYAKTDNKDKVIDDFYSIMVLSDKIR